MWKYIEREISEFRISWKNLDSKVVMIFLSSTIIFVLSWYFANPSLFNGSFIFLYSSQVLIEDLISYIYWFILDFILFFLIPLYIIKILFHQDLKGYGLNLDNMKEGIFISFLSLIAFAPFIYLISRSENFTQYFPLMQSAKEDILIFMIYECFFVVFIFSWEFIFRGYVLFGLEKQFGIYAIFIQMIPFVLLHSGKPFIETFASIFGALLLGYLALRTRSFIYGFMIHAIILFSLDLIAFLR